jgi:MHS family proline/betaine transporter-like MFS transporter
MKFKLLFPAILGTIVEYYDYALYGFFAEIIAQQFFPSQDPTVALLQAYGIFIAGSCSKPLGSILFGYLGDTYGRSLALKISMFGIAIPTVCVGLMPNYAMIGWWAALILLVCRMLQGMFVSGESDGVRIFIYETLNKNRPCFSNSISGMSCMAGVYMASYAATIAKNPELPAYIWRLPFLLGGFFGLLIILMRRYLEETPDFIQHLNNLAERKKATANDNRQNNPDSFINVIIKNKRSIVITALLYGVVGGGYHFFFVFFGNYLSSTLHLMTASIASSHNANAILVYTLCAPLAGYIADRFGPVFVLKTAAIILLGTIAMNTLLISQESFPTWAWMLTAVNLSFLHTPGFVVLFQRFIVGERFRCVSLGHAIGSMLLSGTAPFLSLWIWKITGQSSAPLFYFMFLTLLGYFALQLCDRTVKSKAIEVELMPVKN